MNLNTKQLAAMAGLILAAAVASAFAQDKLPAGHPQVPGANQPALPSGHPTIPGQPGVPAGHPPIAKPSTQPVGEGSIQIKVAQGTKGGPAIGADAVTIELFHRGALLQTVDGKLNAKGETIIGGLPLSLPFQPIIHVKHAGVDYAAIGNPMDPFHSSQRVEMSVFETTEEVPDWKVQMMHIMAIPADDGIHVTQMLAVTNPADRSWLGVKDGQKRISLKLVIPVGATDVAVGGSLRDGCDQGPDGSLINRLPLSPGTSQMQVEYIVPIKNGSATLRFAAPGETANVMVVVPDGTLVTPTGIDSAGVTDMGKTQAQIFKGANLKSGAEISLTLKPGAKPLEKKAEAKKEGESNTPQMIAGVGGGLLLAAGAGFLLLKPKSAITK